MEEGKEGKKLIEKVVIESIKFHIITSQPFNQFCNILADSWVSSYLDP